MKEKVLTTSIPARELSPLIQIDTAAHADTRAAIVGIDENKLLEEVIADQIVDMAIDNANIYDAGLENFLSGGDRKHSDDNIVRLTKAYDKENPTGDQWSFMWPTEVNRKHNTAALEAMQARKRHYSRVWREAKAASKQEDLQRAIVDALDQQKELYAHQEAILSDVVPNPDETIKDKRVYNETHFDGVYKDGEAKIDRLKWKMPRLSNKQLTTAMKALWKKRSRKELTFAHYVTLIGMISAELYKRTGYESYKLRRDKMAKLWVKFNLGERKNTKPYINESEVGIDSYESVLPDSGFGENDLIHAIDMRTKARKMASTPKKNCTYEVAMMSLCDDNE